MNRGGVERSRPFFVGRPRSAGLTVSSLNLARRRNTRRAFFVRKRARFLPERGWAAG